MSALGSKYCQRYASSLGIGWEFPASWLPFGGGTVGLIGSMASCGADRSPAEIFSARDFNWCRTCAMIRVLAILPAKKGEQAMLDLVPTNDAIRPVGDGWEYRHNHIDDLSLYTDHCRIRRIPIVAMRPYQRPHGTLEEPRAGRLPRPITPLPIRCFPPGLSGRLTSLFPMISFSQRKPRSFPRGTCRPVT